MEDIVRDKVYQAGDRSMRSSEWVASVIPLQFYSTVWCW